MLLPLTRILSRIQTRIHDQSTRIQTRILTRIQTRIQTRTHDQSTRTQTRIQSQNKKKNSDIKIW